MPNFKTKVKHFGFDELLCSMHRKNSLEDFKDTKELREIFKKIWLSAIDYWENIPCPRCGKEMDIQPKCKNPHCMCHKYN